MRMETMGEGGAGGLAAGERLALDDGCRWYVVQAKAGRDKAAEDHVRSLGFETFRPLLRRVVVRRHRRIEEEVPLFPGYLFTRFHARRDPWRRIGQPYHVAKVVAASEPFWTPKPVPRGFVEEMRGVGPLFLSPEIAKPYHEGERVRVLDGPYRGFIARVAGLDDAMRVRVVLALFGRDFEASFELDQVIRP